MVKVRTYILACVSLLSMCVAQREESSKNDQIPRLELSCDSLRRESKQQIKQLSQMIEDYAIPYTQILADESYSIKTQYSNLIKEYANKMSFSELSDSDRNDCKRKIVEYTDSVSSYNQKCERFTQKLNYLNRMADSLSSLNID